MRTPVAAFGADPNPDLCPGPWRPLDQTLLIDDLLHPGVYLTAETRHASREVLSTPDPNPHLCPGTRAIPRPWGRRAPGGSRGPRRKTAIVGKRTAVVLLAPDSRPAFAGCVQHLLCGAPPGIKDVAHNREERAGPGRFPAGGSPEPPRAAAGHQSCCTQSAAAAAGSQRPRAQIDICVWSGHKSGFGSAEKARSEADGSCRLISYLCGLSSGQQRPRRSRSARDRGHK